MSFRAIMLASFASLISLSAITASGGSHSCTELCGYIPPTTFFSPGGMCRYTGFSDNVTFPINWSDGSHSLYSTTFTVLLFTGSCCTDVTYTDFASGIVTDGKYAGEPILETQVYTSERHVCDGCQSSSGITKVTVTGQLQIGTKGVGQWIECSANGTVVYSPALTTSPQPTYVTVSIDFTKCNSCVESC